MGKQQGNALFLILIAVALFAALSYAVTQSGRGGGNISREQRGLDGARIIQYAGAVRYAVMRLKLMNGCTDYTISFENSAVAGYANALSPADKSCNVFDANGGGVVFLKPPISVGNSLDYIFNGENRFFNIGDTWATELAMYQAINSRDLCLEINRMLGLPAALAIDAVTTLPTPTKFAGTYNDTNAIPDNGGNAAGFIGAESACLQAQTGAGNYPDSVGSGYFFYHILIHR